VQYHKGTSIFHVSRTTEYKRALLFCSCLFGYNIIVLAFRYGYGTGTGISWEVGTPRTQRDLGLVLVFSLRALFIILWRANTITAVFSD
jgi:hypothetical protein